jgi:aspartyl protease family protein
LTAFEKAFTDARAALEAAGATPGEAETFFIARMAERIASHRAEFPEMSVNGARHSNGVVVNVTVNDRARGVFLVDTGAMLVTLSEPFARRAGLTPVAGPAIQMVTADGRQINAVPVTLGTVQVGDARMESVDAAVIPSAVSPDIDGLLGMSFLHNFAVQIDAARGRLCLRRFAPGRDPAPEGNP